jgi:pimeloyl-ACP methyl ester carboxylesterase
MAEQTLILGAESHLVATLTPAAQTGTPHCVAVLTNSGVIPRSGPHRMNVHLARRFAEMGIPSIRFDMSGLGDSRRSSGTLPVVQQWVADTRSVMDSAQARFSCDRFFMVGFCSGAEVAHLVALEDSRMRAAVLWDLYAYPTLQSKLRTVLYRLRRAGLKTAAQKLLARALPALRSLGQAGAQVKDRAAEVSQVPPPEEYARRIQTLVDGGVELMFAYCGGEPEWFNHHGQFRGMFGRYGFVDKVAFNYLEKSDHLITRREAQQSFTEMVVQWLEQRVLVASRQAAVSR